MNRFDEDRFDNLLCADGQERLIHIWEPGDSDPSPKGVLIAIHGGLAHAGDYCTLARAFSPHGWTTVSFDMRGHERKYRVDIESFDDFLVDLDLFIDWAREAFPGQPLFMVGHSMGGLIAGHHALGAGQSESSPISGYILSSPYWANAVPIPKPVIMLSNVLARITPGLKAPIPDFTESLTHDAAITQRHRDDEADNYRASEGTIRFSSELMRAHKKIEADIEDWQKPVFAVVAGNDELSDSARVEQLLDRIDPDLLERHFYADNFHENFNETNRDEIFAKILDWLAAH